MPRQTITLQRTVSAWLVGLFLGVFSALLGEESNRPNIIFMFTDDMAFGDAGCYGGEFVPTPNIDRLAEEGTRFTQFYVTSPICSPSRAGMLTGMYPSRWEIKTYLQTRAGNRKAGQADFLDPAAPSVARALQGAGYATAHIGKWHLGGGRDVTDAPPFSAYGYDEHVSTYESPEPDPKLTATDWIWSDEDEVKRWDRSAYFVDKTLDFLRRNPDKPCFVNLWPDDVHTPWIPEGGTSKSGHGQHESEEAFKEVLREYDRQVGRLLAGLEELGLAENTVVIFSSDNGPAPDFQGNRRSLGMRGFKGSLYEGGTRMPFIVRWPGKVPAGRVDETTVMSALDLFPTFCRLAEAPLPKEVKFDGEEMSRAFFGEPMIREKPIFWEFGRGKGPAQKNWNVSPSLAIREGKWKLLINRNGTHAELYDLEADRKETRDLAKSHPEVTNRLSEKVLAWKKTLP